MDAGGHRFEILPYQAYDYIHAGVTHMLTMSIKPDLVYFGTLAQRNMESRLALDNFLNDARSPRFLDLNLRAPWYSRETLEWLMSSCNLLKLNIAELELISAWYGTWPTHEEQVRALSSRFNIPTIVVTLGSKGCMGYIDGAFYYQEGQSVIVADTIGSGDAFLAGFLVCRLQQRSPAWSLAYANALGALVASRPGGCPQYDPSEIYSLMKIPQHT